MMIKRLIAAVLLLCTVAALAPTVFAVNDNDALNITGSTLITSNGYADPRFLTDGDNTTYQTSKGKCSITLMNEMGIGSVYLMFDQAYGEYTVENAANSKYFTAGTEGYLHEYINLDEAFNGPVTSVTFHFNREVVRLSEIEVYTVGDVPDHVQIWQPPLEDTTDILLLSTHGDDDQLFFAGLIPHYTSQEGVGVQVAYLTDHRNTTNQRAHEILNGLWVTGCTAYPVMAEFPDFRIDSMKDTYQEFERLGYSAEQLLSYVVGLLRRFKPNVVVGHDIDGEYGHGMHMVYTDCLIKALEISNDEAQFPELAETYGLWDVPKTYLHLYKENTIELDYDQPMDAFDGMTAFEVSQQLGYPCHESQQNSEFTSWINGDNNEITKASQIKKYNPSYFGLYRSTVGEDVKRDDFLENIITYYQQEQLRLEQLEQERLEQEADEQSRLEQERLELDRIEAEKAEQKRQEVERLEQEKLEQERLRLEQEQHQQKITLLIAVGIVAVGVILIIVFFLMRRKAIIRQMED